jgi:hypothetical protein
MEQKLGVGGLGTVVSQLVDKILSIRVSTFWPLPDRTRRHEYRT